MNVVVFIVFAVSFLSLLENYHWIPSLMVHFRDWLLLASVIFCVSILFFSDKKKSIPLLFCFLSVFINTVELRTDFSVQRALPEIEQASELKVFFANINSQNQNKQKLLQYLKHDRPDLVLLVEVNKGWFTSLKEVQDIYSFSKAVLKEDNFGMAVLSQFPIEVEDLFFDRSNLIPVLFMKVTYAQKWFRLALLHPFPPIGSFGMSLRDQAIRVIGKKLGRKSGKTLVCGDFNTTPWSQVFQDFVLDSRLNYVSSSGSLKTWPSPIPLIAIDHCLIRGMSVKSLERGPDISSDHYPLRLVIGLGADESRL